MQQFSHANRSQGVFGVAMMKSSASWYIYGGVVIAMTGLTAVTLLAFNNRDAFLGGKHGQVATK